MFNVYGEKGCAMYQDLLFDGLLDDCRTITILEHDMPSPVVAVQLCVTMDFSKEDDTHELLESLPQPLHFIYSIEVEPHHRLHDDFETYRQLVKDAVGQAKNEDAKSVAIHCSVKHDLLRRAVEAEQFQLVSSGNPRTYAYIFEQ